MGTTTFRGAATDFRISGSSSAYATARSTGNYSIDHDNIRVGQGLDSGTFYVYKCYIVFNTSAIPDGDTITNVNLALKISQDNSYTDFTIRALKYNWKTVADGSGTGGDRDNVFDLGAAGATDGQVAVLETPTITTVGASVGSVLTFEGLDTNWVSKTGNTKYALRSQADIDNSAPTGGEFVWFYSGDYATESYRPALIVTHSSGGGARITRLYAQGVLTDTPVNMLG